MHPAWAWMYMFDPDKAGAISILPLMVGHAALVIGGWYVASILIRKGLQGALLYAGGVFVLVLFVLVVVGINRLGTAADYLGWRAKTGISVFSVKLGWAFIVSLLALFGSALYIAIELGRDGRRVRSR